MYSEQQAMEFEEYANPHAWFLVASELHEQAIHLKENISLTISLQDHHSHEIANWNTSNRTIILLAGFSLENILKAFLVYENPNMIGKGFLDKKLKSHKLTKLAVLLTCAPYKDRSMKTLRYFEDGIESWARYPCGLNWAQTKSQKILDKKIWNNYLWLMRAYEKRIKKIFSQRWKGPHKFDGSFQVNGSWLN